MLKQLKQNYKIFFLGFVLALMLGFLISQDFIFGAFFALTLVFIILLFDKQKFILLLIIFIIILGQLVRLPVPGSSEGAGAVLASDIIVPAFAVVWFLNILAKKKNISFGVIDSLLVLFLASALLSLVWSLESVAKSDLLVSSFYLVRLFGYAGLFFITKDIVKNDTQFAKKIVIAFISVAFILAVLGFLQLLFFPSLAGLATKAGWDPHFKRIFSTFLDPNYLGAFFSISLALILSFFFELKKEKGKILLLMFSLTIAVALILTFSRSAYLLGVAAFFMITLFKSKKTFIWGLIIIFSIFATTPRIAKKISESFEAGKSGSKRIISWQNTWEICEDNFWTGVGYNNMRLAQESYGFYDLSKIKHAASGSDSSLLFILATTGVFGFLLFLLFWVAILIKSYRLFRSSLSPPFFSALSLAVFSSVLGMFFAAQFINAFFYPFIMIPLFVLAGALLGMESAHFKIKGSRVDKTQNKGSL